MDPHLTDHRDGFGPGLTVVTDHRSDPTGIGFVVHRLAAGERLDTSPATETAYLLMHGSGSASGGGASGAWQRGSLFDDLPSALHVAAGTPVQIRCDTDTELTVYTTANTREFKPRMYLPAEVRDEHRGKGQVRDACYRFVRTIFDDTNTDAAAELVLGEVINMPGRWSSYPPHHHAQPEIYHYRFTAPQGYGHAELGERVFKVRHNDTMKIMDLNDHSQAAAPGYGMYYTWVIRHLPESRYEIPEFTEEHRWIMEPGADFWWPDNAE